MNRSCQSGAQSATHVRVAAALFFIGAALLWGCTGCYTPKTSPEDVTRAAAHLHVLMINGGGTREQNYQSHLLHVQHLLDLLAGAGVSRQQVSIFSADGSDPAADLAVRAQQLEPDFWLLSGTRLEQSLRTPITYANSEVPGMEMHPATKAALDAWFDAASQRLQPGDTLLVYVTDHGTKNPDDLANNHIVLWGKDESLSVRELQAFIEKLNPAVRVVALMSQCFSGAFAHLINAHATDGLPSGAVCGYYSSTADRRAYGCYPENRGRDNVGHSFHFFQALAATGNFSEAQARVLVADGSPDVPLKSSDAYLQNLLRRATGDNDDEFATLVDSLLHEAWKDKGAWEPEIRLLDRIGAAYGCFSPRSLAEIDAQMKDLPPISEQLKNTGNAWHGALADGNQANLDRFLAAHADWTERLNPSALKDLDDAATRSVTKALLADVGSYTRADAATRDRLNLLNGKGRSAEAASYRMEVRLAVVLRMRTILTSIAGRVHLATRATDSERAAYAALQRCEDLSLPVASRAGTTLVADAVPFPPFDEDVKRAQAALPAWMGIQFREAKADLRTKVGLTAGASAVMMVYPDTPAEAAGLQQGDIIIGPPGAPFSERNQIRTWTMLSKVGEPKTLEILRGEARLQVTLAPKPYPLKWPELPGPPKIGSAAPALQVTPYRGVVPASLANDTPVRDTGAAATPHLLFFWATWCAPCKASLPEVLAFERERQTPVIAITDEPSDRLDAFFKSTSLVFPDTVAIDDYRRDFVAYGVSGTPTFVLVNADGTVRSYSTGYKPDKGLGIDGWMWEKN